MDSLYGGKPGVSFVIKASFASIETMTAAFKQGANYTAVWYGEYVLIDTKNKNHKDNGKIYRRGLDYQNTLGGAEYIGQIVGPSSGTPYFQIDNLPSTLESAKIPANGEDIWKKYPTGKDKDGKYIISENGPGTDIGIFSFTQENALVPGRTDAGKYNDGIRYTWVNIRMDDADSDSWFYVGLEIPYLVIGYKAKSVSPYDSSGNRSDLPTVERIDDKKHPYYEEFMLGIPKGIKGDSLKNLKIITPTSSDRIYTPEQITVKIDSKTGNFVTTLGTAGYPGQQEDITNQYKILVYEHVYYDNKAEGEKVLIYLGDYKIITAVFLDDDGTLRIQFTHDGTTSFVKKITWITSVTLDPETGVFTVIDNRNTQMYRTVLDWINNLYIDEATGQIAVHHVDNTKNTGTAKNGKKAEILSAKLKLIVSARMTTDGRIIFKTNTGDEIELKAADGNGTFHLRFINDVRLLTNINDDKHIQIQYSDSSDWVKIGNPINYIQDMVVRSSDWHLLVLYNDPTHRVTAKDLDSNSRDKNGNLWVSGITGSDGTVYGTSVYWRDMGTIKDQSGVLIGFNVTYAELNKSPYNNIIDYLNANYKYGLTGANNVPNGPSLEGKIVTYKKQGVEDVEFYAYDYNLSRWYYLGTLRESSNLDARLLNWTTTTGSAKNEAIEQLNTHGVLITTQTVNVVTDGLGSKDHYWAWNYTW